VTPSPTSTGTAAPAVTLASPAVARFSRRWAAALATSGRVMGTVDEVAAALRPLTLRLALAVRDGGADGDLGRDVGATLMRHGYGSTAVIGPTVDVLLDAFVSELGAGLTGDAEPTGRPAAVLRARAGALAAAIATGFAEITRDHALAAQEELQRAALASVRTAEAERRTSEARFRALFTQAAVGIGIIDMTGRVIDGNAAWGDQMGFSVDEMRGRHMTELVQPGSAPEAMVHFTSLLTGARDAFRLEFRHASADGRLLFLDLSVSRVRGGGSQPDFLVGVAVDVTERKRLEERLWHEARHDPLTGLPNRTLFFERLGHVLSEPVAAGKRRPVGICYIDLDGFKSINDGLGHDVGDRLLVRVAERLRAAVSAPGSLLARLGGDEFGIITDGIGTPPARPADGATGTPGTPGDPADQARLVLDALADPMTVDGRELTVSASVGVVDTISAGTDADALMRAADISLYQAKSRGRGRWERHDPLAAGHQVTRHALATEMAAALTRGEFFLEYQPLVSLTDGTVRRVEALVRWRHPRLGLLHPDEFVGMAEENGHITALGRWVLTTACRAGYEWYRRFPAAGIGVNVNVSVAQLHDTGLAGHVRDTLAETGLPPHLLYLELTESAVLGEEAGPVDALTGLAASGVRLVIDDFGTGYSNLVHLTRLPASELKIAGSFLKPSPGGSTANDKIVNAIVGLAHSLGLTVTAEGVETTAQADRLRALHCDTAQGWLFASPAAQDAITELIGREYG
jgi:PAS domain S-box-containing protein